MSIRQRRTIAVVGATLLAAALLAPLVILSIHGLTLTGMTEESTGYRYFYTLRILYGRGERPWLPQGQLVGLAHIAIQIGLTLAGFSPTSLFPRIDLFAYSAAALPHVLALAAFVWMAAVLPPESYLAISGIAALTFLGGRSPLSDSSNYSLVLPDYVSWVEPVSLIAAGWLLRMCHSAEGARWKNDVSIGVFAGLCLSIKPTYGTFVLPLAIVAAATTRPAWRAVLRAVSSGIVASATWLVVTWAYYLTDMRATVTHFARLSAFVDSIPSSPSWYDWLMGPELWGGVTFTNLAGLLLLCVSPSLIFLPRRPLSLGLLAGSLASLYVLHRRFENQTFIEVKGYFLAASIAWTAAVLGPALGAGLIRGWSKIVRPAIVVATVAIWMLVITQARLNNRSMLPLFKTADAGAHALSRCLAATPGRTMFLIPDNNFRPTTVDSAIFKGGADVNHYYWGASKYVHEMFPDRGYAVGETTKAIAAPELDTYSKIVFVSLPGTRQADEARLKTMFAVSFDQFDCSCTIDFKYHVVNACRRNTP